MPTAEEIADTLTMSECWALGGQLSEDLRITLATAERLAGRDPPLATIRERDSGGRWALIDLTSIGIEVGLKVLPDALRPPRTQKRDRWTGKWKPAVRDPIPRGGKYGLVARENLQQSRCRLCGGRQFEIDEDGWVSPCSCVRAADVLHLRGSVRLAGILTIYERATEDGPMRLRAVGLSCPRCGNIGTEDPIVFAETAIHFHAIRFSTGGEEPTALRADLKPEIPDPGEGSDPRMLCMVCTHEWLIPPVVVVFADPGKDPI